MTNLLSAQDIADRLRVSKRKANGLISQMQHVTLPGGRRRVTEEALAAWIQEHTETPQTAKPKRRRKPTMTQYGDWWNHPEMLDRILEEDRA